MNIWTPIPPVRITRVGAIVPLVLLIAPGSLAIPPAQAGSALHVDADASGPVYDGFGWCTAFHDLQEALGVATAGDVIRVADGVYLPDSADLVDPRAATFELVAGVTIEAGYAGCGADDPDERNWALYETVLSGDLEDDDGSDFENTEENCYHVVTANDLNDTTELDGLTITAGRADGLNPAEQYGAGMLVSDSAVIVTHVTFSRNQAQVSGGAVSISGGELAMGACSFNLNAAAEGGAISVDGETDLATVTGCVFEDNNAERGGAIVVRNYASLVALSSCTFNRNLAGVEGGAIYGGGIWGVLISVDCMFTANQAAADGGAVFSGFLSQVWTNCVFSENVATGRGGAVYCDGGEHTLVENCTFTTNRAEHGGGIYMEHADAAGIEACRFTGNVAWSGGALYVYGGDVAVNRSRFRRNYATAGDPVDRGAPSTPALARHDGGGIFAWAHEFSLSNSVFAGNAGSYYGGGLYDKSSQSSTSNCTFVGNTLEDLAPPGAGRPKGAGAFYDVAYSYDTEHFVRNCIFWENRADSQDPAAQIDIDPASILYSCVQGIDDGWGHASNIGTDPFFVDPEGPDGIYGTEDDNLRLGHYSGSVNTGDPATVVEPEARDVEGNPRLTGCRIDRGAYEAYDGQSLFDFDDDNDIDLADFAAYQLCFSAATANPDWLESCLCVFDTHDGDIGLVDLGSLVANLRGPR